MLTSNNWIKKFVPELNVSANEFADKMTISGSKVENYKYLNDKFDKVIIGKIIEINKHPDADRLLICQVDIGDSITQIVTAAKNVFVGAVVPIVLPGGYVDDGNGGKLKIKEGKLRGVDSFGMFCSVHELGYTVEDFTDAADDGIYILGDDAKVGSNIDEYLGLDDFVTEYEITSNRVDCFSIYGIAREVSATFNKKLIPYTTKNYTDKKLSSELLEVDIKSNLCKRYCAKIVKDVKIAPSPKWMQKLLRSVGIRPINNIVDITNYILCELGQPMHAFDYNNLYGHKIVVDTADISNVVTLDGVNRNVDSDILMINDAKSPVAIAGIMGCENSKITDETNTIVFEAACFDGTNIRLSSKKLGLRSESSAKFEKGLDPNTCLIAINRACELIEELCCGTVVDGFIDIYEELPTYKKVEFNLDRCNKFLGTNISIEEVKNYFNALELEWDMENNYVIVPSFRQDLNIFADIAEEVARFYGYDKIDTTLPTLATQGNLSDKISLQNDISKILNDYGYNEIMTYSFEGKTVFDKLLLNSNSEFRKVVEIRNPLGEEFAIMRTLPYNGILNSIKTNIKNRNKDVRLFEFANTYLPNDGILPDERIKITLANSNENIDFFDIKGAFEEIFDLLGMLKFIEYKNDKDIPYFHTGIQAKIYYKGNIIGELGQLHPKVMRNYDINRNTFLGMLDFPTLLENINYTNKYTPIPRFPNSIRDLCFIMDSSISVIELEKVFEKNGKNILENYTLFDIYTGDKLPKNKKSVTYSLSFRANDRTLTDDEINVSVNKIIKVLSSIGIELRQ